MRSWPGRGGVFSVSVPLARAQAAAPAKLAELNGKLLSGAQVLCIDNEDSILIGMNSLLTRWGCQVWTARNREECAALLERRPAPATGAGGLPPRTMAKPGPN